MPLPVAHGLVGASILLAWREPKDKLPLWQMLLWGAALGNLPDLDLALAWVLDWGATVHGGLTHSLFFALCVGVLITGWRGAWRLWRFREMLIYTGAIFSHGVLDMLVRKEFGGAALYWPLSDEKLRFGLFDYFAFYPGSEPLETVLRRALQISAYEAALFAPCLLLAWLIYTYRRKAVRPAYQTGQWPMRVD